MSQPYFTGQATASGLNDAQDQPQIQDQLSSFDYAGDFLSEPGFGSDQLYTPNPFTFDISDYDNLLPESVNPEDMSLTSTQTQLRSAAPMPQDLNMRDDVADQSRSRPRSTKRTRDGAQPDILQACWNSPLCPQSAKVKDGHPDPSTCDGACMPFLFPKSPSSDGQALSDLPQTPIEYDFFDKGLQMNPLLPEDLVTSPSVEGTVESDIAEANAMPAPSAADNTSIRQQPRRTAKVKTEPINVDALNESVAESEAKSPKGRTKGRMPHNQVERKYRESLNAQLEALRRVVPSLDASNNGQAKTQMDGADMEDIPNASLAGKPSKALILANATSYIKHLERERQREQVEMARLKERMAVMSRLLSVGVKSNGGGCDECQVLGWVRGINLGEDGAGDKSRKG